ncbi:MAG: class IV adenylate cyclase [Mariniblastus sp.]|nr:class IV adenylate cyclase [Mariniblastus sp.]
MVGRNIEIKARLSRQDFDRIHRVAGELKTQPHVVLEQRDTFFNTFRDRLKIREFSDGTAELISYTRKEQDAPKPSEYTRTPIPEPKTFCEAMASTVGIRGVVIKRRDLFLVGQTRIHLDQVEGLGSFLELEVVLRDDQSPAEGVVVANELMDRLGIDADWLISNAYIDLLESNGV